MKKTSPKNTQSQVVDTDLLYSIASHIAWGDTLDETLASLVDATVGLVNCDECLTYVRQGGELVPWVWKYVEHPSHERSTVSISDGFAAALSHHRVPLAVSGTRAGDSFRVFEEWSSDRGETSICIPFLSRSQLVGAVAMHHWKPRPYSRREIRLLSTIGHLVGVEIRVAQLEKQNIDLQLERKPENWLTVARVSCSVNWG